MGDDKQLQSCVPRSVSSYYYKGLQVNHKNHSVTSLTHFPRMITPVIITPLCPCGLLSCLVIPVLFHLSLFLWCTSGPTYSYKLIKTWLFSILVCVVNQIWCIDYFWVFMYTLLLLQCLALTQYCVNLRFHMCALSVFYMLSTKDREYNIFIMLLVVLYDLRAKIFIFECLWNLQVWKTLSNSHQINYAFVFSWQP